MLRPLKKTHGLVLLLGLGLLAVLWILALGLASSSVRELRLSQHAVASERALWAAESGLELACKAIIEDPTYRPKLDMVAMSQGKASYRVIALTQTQAPIAIPENSLYLLSTGRDDVIGVERRVVAVLRLGAPDKASPLAYSVFAKNLELRGGVTIDSFDSKVGAEIRGENANVATNSTEPGAITLKGGSRILGGMQVGVGGKTGEAKPLRPTTQSDQTIWKDWSCYSTGEEKALTSPLEFAPVTIPSVGTTDIKVDWKGADLQPGSYQNLYASGGGDVRLEGGTYVFSSLKLTGGSKLSFHGTKDKPVVIYISKSLDLEGGTLSNTSLQPRNLTFMLGKDANAKISGGAQAYAVFYGPEADMALKGGTDLFGAVVGRSVTLLAGAEIHYDVDLLKNPPPSIPNPDNKNAASVISWQRF